MKKYFVTFEQAVALKELGFDEPCLAFYYTKTGFLSLGQKPEYLVDKRKASYIFGNEKHDVTLALLKSQVFEWFRKEYGYWSYIKEAIKGSCRFYVEKFDEKFFTSDVIDSYEEAESACIDKLIEIVKNNLDK